jgi:hypothetical protein
MQMATMNYLNSLNYSGLPMDFQNCLAIDSLMVTGLGFLMDLLNYLVINLLMDFLTLRVIYLDFQSYLAIDLGFLNCLD